MELELKLRKFHPNKKMNFLKHEITIQFKKIELSEKELEIFKKSKECQAWFITKEEFLKTTEVKSTKAYDVSIVEKEAGITIAELKERKEALEAKEKECEERMKNIAEKEKELLKVDEELTRASKSRARKVK